MLEVGIIFKHRTRTTNTMDSFAPERWIAYAAREPRNNAMMVLASETLKLFNRYFSASILWSRSEKLSTENTFGKKLGGTAITSVPGLNEQQMTYMYGKSQHTVRITDKLIPSIFPISPFFTTFLHLLPTVSGPASSGSTSSA